jgi:hypothetical protein
MKPNALDSAVVAVLCCCSLNAWFLGLGGASAGVHERGCGATVLVIEPWRLGQSPLEQLSAPLDFGPSGMPVPRFQREG